MTDRPEPAWTPPPPGSTREQLPDDILALARRHYRPYTSTACDTATLLAETTADHPDLAAELGVWRTRLHSRCRLNNKFTGQLCDCPCHRPDPAES